LGFAREKTNLDINLPEDGCVIISDEQRERIINLDETALTLDGTRGRNGGRPPTIFYARDVRSSGATQANKTGCSVTFIGGSTSSGTPLPPHFQMRTGSDNPENYQINTECFLYAPAIMGKWGFGKMTPRGVTFACNKKGGMDAEELHKYLVQAILPLYPDAADLPGKRVLIKIDSGPGRMNEAMLVELRVKGFYLLPGLPNSTHVTQETDQNYGHFKNVVRRNLESLTIARQLQKLPLRIPDLVWIVFGGGKFDLKLRKAFDDSFGIEANKHAWCKVGAVPLTRNCMWHGDVSHHVHIDENGTIDLEADPETEKLRMWEEMNKACCNFLTSLGCHGDHFLAESPKCYKKKAPITVPHSTERIAELMKASTAGSHFHATGGEVLNSDDFFIAREKKRHDTLLETLKKKRGVAEKHQKLNETFVATIFGLSTDQDHNGDTAHLKDKFSIKQLKPLVAWFLLGEKVPTKKEDLVNKWVELRTAGEPEGRVYWTGEDTNQLAELESETLTIADTELGRLQQKKKEDLKASLTLLPVSELEAILAARKAETAPSNVAAPNVEEEKSEDN
jgi:hypothetical protein